MSRARRGDLAVDLTTVLDALDDAIITTDLRGLITSWNIGAQRLYGFTREAAMGQSASALFGENQADEEHRILGAARDGVALRNIEAVRLRRDGVPIAVVLSITPLYDEDGTLTGTLRIERDLAGRHLADRAAWRLAAIVESSDDAIISKDLNGFVTSWNVAAERMFGYTAAEIIGHSIRTLIPADRQDEENHVLAAIRRGDKVDHFETIRRRKDGSQVPISLTVSPIRDVDGRVVGASKIARDISDRKRAEEERARLLVVAQRNAAITEKLNDVGAIVASGLDRTQIVQAVTDTGTELTGAEIGAFFCTVVDAQGESQSLLTLSGERRDALSTMPTHLTTTALELALDGAFVFRSADITQEPRSRQHPEYYPLLRGSLPVKSYLAVSVRARSGEMLGALFFGHSDAAAFTADHERLAIGAASWAAVALENARLYAEAQSANRLKDDFLATLSHELRTPLNAILGYTRMIRSGMVAPGNQHRVVATIERNATSLTQIVEDVLDVSRIVSGKLHLHIERVRIADVVKNSIEGVMPAANAKGIRVDYAIAASVDTVPADIERLQQVVRNLLSNAVKFTGRGGHVDIRVTAVEDQVEIVVADNGIGIRPDFLPHIFERFRQADSSITRERGGLGLGLAIARQLVEMHGGTIAAASEGLNRGSTFRVCLPVSLTGTAARHADATPLVDRESSPRPDLTGVRVLVVDDDADALMLVRDILESAGAQAAIADSASAALDAITAASPAVIVADLAMPQMDGFQLIERIRHSDNVAIRTIPAVALTAYARSEDRAKALRAGFQMHIAKPIDPATLLRTVLGLIRVSAPNQ